MTPHTVIITGANSGIGKAAAEKFAADGHHVIMACRNPARSEPAREEVVAAAKNGRVDLMQLDVSSFESVRAFCELSRVGMRGWMPSLTRAISARR